MGEKGGADRWIPAELTADVTRREALDTFLRVNLTKKDGRLLVSPFHFQSSGAIKSMYRANGLAHIPPGKSPIIPAGTILNVEPF